MTNSTETRCEQMGENVLNTFYVYGEQLTVKHVNKIITKHIL